MAATDPEEMLGEVAPGEVPMAAPPPDANYRAAEVQGLSCASCTKFNYESVIEEDGGMIPVGTCDLWEARVRGDYVSDGYAEDSPPMDDQGNEDWNFVAGETTLAAIHFAEPQQEEDNGFVKKTILRTGTFGAIPTRAGLIRKPLHIVRDGKSDHKNGTIAMAELVENFKSGAIPNVQIPLSDDSDDHKNIAAINTGFVRDIWIEDEEGEAKLVAKMEFTEPEVRDKVLRGSVADVSAGVPWRVRSRGKDYGACLEHVALTYKPFIDGLGPFLAASDERPDEIEVDHFGDSVEVTVDRDILKIPVEVQKHLAAIALSNQLNLSADYTVEGIEDGVATVSHEIAEATWSVPFDIRDANTITLSPVNEWKLKTTENADPSDSNESADEPNPPAVKLSELEYARRLRRIRSEQGHPNTTRGANMPLSQAELDRLELSDEQRAAFAGVLDENADLRAKTREAEVDQRVKELEALGLKQRPGALKLYRQVALADDGGPAAVLLSDKGHKESVTALDILDRFIEAIRGSDEKVVLSDQHLVKDDDPKPPDNADGETETPFEERLAGAKAAIGRQ